jgi:hypothetical protein
MFTNFGETLEDDTRVVRYMGLGAFLMLLLGKVFIPKLKTLQAIDPLESFLPEYAIPPQGDGLEELESQRKWFEEKADENERRFLHDTPSDNAHSRRIIYKIWLRELASRRCVWCWNRDPFESMGLWTIYGSKGVAIVSTIGRVKECLQEFAFTGSFAAVAYVHRYTPDHSLSNKDLLKRPYFFKTEPYSFEKELRFVYPINPQTFEDERGVMADVDSRKLVQQVIFSPFIPLDEARYLQELLQKGLPPQPHIATEPSMTRSLERIPVQEDMHSRYEIPWQLESRFDELTDKDLPTILKAV